MIHGRSASSSNLNCCQQALALIEELLVCVSDGLFRVDCGLTFLYYFWGNFRNAGDTPGTVEDCCDMGVCSATHSTPAKCDRA